MRTAGVAAARERLRQALVFRDAADLALYDARTLAEKACALVDEIAEQVSALRETDRGVSVDRAEAIVSALRSGAAPMFVVVPGVTEGAAALHDVQSRLAAAEMALAKFGSEEAEALSAAERARDDVEALAHAVVLAEADSRARYVLDLEAEAFAARAPLGGPLDWLACGKPRRTRDSDLGDAAKRVIASSDGSEITMPNTPAWRVARRANEAWRALEAALTHDADAQLSLDEPVEEESKAA
jgi:hypothetical protein